MIYDLGRSFPKTDDRCIIKFYDLKTKNDALSAHKQAEDLLEKRQQFNTFAQKAFYESSCISGTGFSVSGHGKRVV
jgi:hypothetical protein